MDIETFPGQARHDGIILTQAFCLLQNVRELGGEGQYAFFISGQGNPSAARDARE